MRRLFKRRYTTWTFMLNDCNNCSFGNGVFVVCSRWQIVSFVRQRGCSLVEPPQAQLQEGKPRKVWENHSARGENMQSGRSQLAKYVCIGRTVQIPGKELSPTIFIECRRARLAFEDKCLCGKVKLLTHIHSPFRTGKPVLWWMLMYSLGRWKLSRLWEMFPQIINQTSSKAELSRASISTALGCLVVGKTVDVNSLKIFWKIQVQISKLVLQFSVCLSIYPVDRKKIYSFSPRFYFSSSSPWLWSLLEKWLCLLVQALYQLALAAGSSL